MTTHRITLEFIVQDQEALATAAQAVWDALPIDSIGGDGPRNDDGSVNVPYCLELVFDPGEFHDAGLHMISFSTSVNPWPALIATDSPCDIQGGQVASSYCFRTRATSASADAVAAAVARRTFS